MPLKSLTPLSLLLDVFLLDCRARRLRPATLTFYRQQITYLIDFAIDSNVTEAAHISPALLRAYLVSLQDRGLADASIQTAVRAVRAFCNFLVKEEVVKESPMQRVKAPKAEKRNPTAFTDDEIRQLYDTADNTRDRAIILCLLDTGVRVAEFVAWNVGDVNLKTGVITIRQPKNRHERTAYLGLHARRDYLKWYAELPDISPDAPVWVNLHKAYGERLTTSGINQVFKRLGKATSIKPCGPHKMRRTFAIMSLRAGMDVYTLQRLMGHKSLEMLLRYLALLDDDLRQAHGKHGPVDRLL